MPELDRLKEEVAYLKFWQGIAVVIAISLSGWLVSSGADAPSLSFRIRDCRRNIARRRDYRFVSTDRPPNRQDRGDIVLETIAAIVAFAVIVLIVGIALHAAFRK